MLMVWLSWLNVRPVWGELKNAFLKANYFWVVISMAISLLSHYLRAYRWNDLLEPIGHKIPVSNSFMYVLSAYLINYGIPRLGEISRCTLAYKYDKVPVEKGFGTVILERMTDSIIFLFLFSLALLVDAPTYLELLKRFVITKFSEHSNTLPKLIPGIMALGLVLSILYYFRKKIKSVLGNKFTSVIRGFAEGITSVKKLKYPFRFFGIGLGIWLCYFYSLYFCMLAFEGTCELGHKEALVLLLIGTFAVMFSPGGLGAYPLMLAGILMNIYGTDRASAFAMPWMAWGSQFLLILISGLISLMLLPIINSKKK
ncbi:MAG: flippase-like domain-containing protein [Bacteroidia bacterium]|nr:flippase-like domain-containing protein [Bacteroidia bacterium]